MAMLTMGGANLPAPSALKISLIDVSAQADRTASGLAVIDRIADKRRIHLKWALMTAAQMQSLLTASGSGAFFSVTYPDPVTAASRTATVFAESRAAGILRMIDGSPVWTDVEITLTER